MAPAPINVPLAALNDFPARRGLGAEADRREEVPQRRGPRASSDLEARRYLCAVEREASCCDRAVALPHSIGRELPDSALVETAIDRKVSDSGVPPHTERNREAFYMLRGTLELEADGQRYRLEPGDFLCILRFFETLGDPLEDPLDPPMPFGPPDVCAWVRWHGSAASSWRRWAEAEWTASSRQARLHGYDGKRRPVTVEDLSQAGWRAKGLRDFLTDQS